MKARLSVSNRVGKTPYFRRGRLGMTLKKTCTYCSPEVKEQLQGSQDTVTTLYSPSLSGTSGKAQEELTRPQVQHTDRATQSLHPLTLLCAILCAWEAQMRDVTTSDRKKYRPMVKHLRLSPAVLRASLILWAEL